jgi:uncharacterized protein (DUF885 family)
MLDRRAFLLSTAAVGASTALPAFAQNKAGTASPQLAALFDTLLQEQLRQSPESATQLGLDKGPNADLRSRLGDNSAAGRAAQKALTQSQLKRLEAFPRAGLTPADALNLDVVTYTRRSSAAVQRFDYGGSSYGPSPYVVSQLSGSYQSTPDFLDTKHPVNDRADADAYLSRLTAFAARLDGDSDRMRHDAGLGILPPDFLMDITIGQLEKLRTPASDALLVQSIARRAAAKGLGDYTAPATKIYEGQVLPALDRQIALAKSLRPRATADAGVWKVPDGEAFYATALRNTTTTAYTADEVHRFGIEQGKAIKSRLDAELRKQGMTKGTVGERMDALFKDPKQLFSNDDAGRAQLIAFCNERLAAIAQKLPLAFKRVPQYKFEVRRVPPQTENGAAAAFAQPPALDGSRPGLVYFNLRDVNDWPRFRLSTTVYHEGLPGHQYEGGLALANTGLPLIRKQGGFSGYGEGWALYAEQLSDEIGMYDDDPLGRIGYLVAQLFRADRCVIDTGIHSKRWTREQAVQFFVDQEGGGRDYFTREVDRYCVNPGQACSYKLGHTVFVTLRDEAKAKMGSRFDVKEFHEAVLANGRVPLEILQAQTRKWMA